MKDVSLRTACLAAVAASAALVATAVTPLRAQAGLRAALAFHASFDGSIDAVHAAGDRTLYSAATFARRQEATPGLPPGGEVQHTSGLGRFGDALRFTTRRKPAVFFKGERNVPYTTEQWAGTVSFWLSVDPAAELEMGFCDPIQITPNAWNNAAFFVEFEKTPASIPFRLGAYADLTVWNPTNRRFEDIPGPERPLITVDQPPFARGTWTHVVFTFDQFNTGQANGLVKLYLDGRPAGELAGRQQTFTWARDQSAINLGAGYIGLMDEVSIFSRALSDAEVKTLYELPKGVSGLLP